MILTIEALLAARAAAMADHDGVPVAVVHIFGAANQLMAELGTARDGLIGEPGKLADVLSDLADAEAFDTTLADAHFAAVDDHSNDSPAGGADGDDTTTGGADGDDTTTGSADGDDTTTGGAEGAGNDTPPAGVVVPANPITTLRHRYAALAGKNPSPAWKADVLEAKIAALEAAG